MERQVAVKQRSRRQRHRLLSVQLKECSWPHAVSIATTQTLLGTAERCPYLGFVLSGMNDSCADFPQSVLKLLPIDFFSYKNEFAVIQGFRLLPLIRGLL